MNVLIIHASPRRKGVTSTLLSEIEASLSSDHKIETVRISDLEMKPCIGCMKCRPDQPCILPPDDANVLAEKVRWADFIIIGCPVYWGNMPGRLKSFFDRNVPLFEYAEAKAIRYVPRPQLRGKRAALVVSCYRSVSLQFATVSKQRHDRRAEDDSQSWRGQNRVGGQRR